MPVLGYCKCAKCGAEWRDKPGHWQQHKRCPVCGGLYWAWSPEPPEFVAGRPRL